MAPFINNFPATKVLQRGYTFLLAAVMSLVAWSAQAESGRKPAAPFYNPHWAQGSAYPVAHGTADFTPYAGPTGPTRRLSEQDVIWKTIGPINGYAPVYSSPYPNGKRVIWVGGYDRIAKLDADTLDVLTTYAIGGNTYFGDEEIRRHIERMDQLGDEALVEYSLDVFAEPYRSVESAYHLLTAQNELYIPHRSDDGAISLRVYGETDAGDPTSAIELRREWKVPAAVSRDEIMSVNMTSDGWVITVTQDGVIIVLSQDLSKYHALKLPGQRAADEDRDFFTAFVRNGLSVDDRGGIYVVTRDHLHRVQWTGERLSMDAANGAWAAPYPNDNGLGSGTSPGLMGWGPNEDHLVIIADGTRSNNVMVFWRDNIPDDWQGIPGYDRRVAGVTPAQFGVSPNEQVQIENAPVVYGHGAFFNNTFPVKRLADQGSATRQWMAESFYMRVPGHGARGGSMVQWNQAERVLETAWRSQENFVSTVCTVSGATELIYCWGARNGEWTLEGVDWYSGASRFHYVLGKSHRFNPLGAPIIVTPAGDIDCGCSGGMGMVRIASSTEQ